MNLRMTFFGIAMLTMGAIGSVVLMGAKPRSNVPDLNQDYEVTLWLEEEDCPDGELCDISPALERILSDCRSQYPGVVGTGCRIHIDAGSWRLSNTVTLCRNHAIYGSGGRGAGARTMVNVDQGVTAFRTADYDECAGAGRGRGAAWSEITDMGIVSPQRDAGVPHHYGIRVNARTGLERLVISGFTQGIRIEGTTASVIPCPLLGPTRLCAPNSNNWSIRDTRIIQSAHAGIHVVGGNANAGRADLVDVMHSCRDADALSPADNADPELGSCAAIIDDSFLGNTWIAPHTARSTDVSTGTTFPGYDFRNDSQSSVLVGAYAETDQEFGYLERNNMALGGLSNWEGPGLSLRGSRANRLTVRNTRDPNNVVELRMGGDTSGGSFIQFSSEIFGDYWPLRIKARKILAPGQNYEECSQCTDSTETIGSSKCSSCWDGQYRFDVANLDRAVPFTIDASDNGAYPMGTMWMHRQPALGGGQGLEWCPGLPNTSCQ